LVAVIVEEADPEGENSDRDRCRIEQVYASDMIQWEKAFPAQLNGVDQWVVKQDLLGKVRQCEKWVQHA
jgi:hypothetical protein